MGVTTLIEVNTHEAKTKLSFLLRQVEEKHEKVRICRNGRPVALLVPVEAARNPLEQHAVLHGIQFVEDPSDPLAESDWPDETE